MPTIQEPVLWGGLKLGPHAVGFRSLFELDRTRLYDREFAAQAPKRYRPILIAVWYPAAKNTAASMKYHEYFDLRSDDPEVSAFAARLTAFTREIVCRETFANKRPEELSAEEQVAFERLANLKTTAGRNARPAKGRFPVVINHAGLRGTYEDNSVLFEFLASHGYVVLASSYPMEDAVMLNLDWDLSRSFRDMNILLRHAWGLPFADGERLAVMGQSYGGQAALAWCAEPNSPVDAVVSLDSTVENDPEGLDFPGFAPLKAQFDRAHTFTAAALLFASVQSEVGPKFDTFDPYLKHAVRYEATVSGLTHNDYISQGAIRSALLPGLSLEGRDAQQVRESYDRVCRIILGFLDAVLKQDARGEGVLDDALNGKGLDERFRLCFKKPDPVPPTCRQVVTYASKHGAAEVKRWLEKFRGGKLERKLHNAGDCLLEDRKAAKAVAVLEVAAALQPKSAQAQNDLGDALAAAGKRAEAIAAFRRLLKLLPNDSQGLEKDEKQFFKQHASEMIEKLRREK